MNTGKWLIPTIGLVLDPEFSSRLGGLSGQMHVWALDSTPNRASAEAIWEERPTYLPDQGITLFQSCSGQSEYDACAGILPAIDLHHGEFSQEPPYQVVEVFGCLLTDALRSRFGEFGFNEFSPTSDGFIARRLRDV